MGRIGKLPPELVEAVADGQSVLFLGAGFSHGVTGLDWPGLIEKLRDRLPDAAGWESLDALDRAQLFVQAHGREELERELAALLPTADALRNEVGEFHRTLLSMPFPVIVTTNYDGLAEATLAALDEPFRVIVDDDEVADALRADDGCRLVVKMHGDLLIGDTIVLTREDYLNYDEKRPAMVALLESLLLTRTFFFYGFGLSDPNFLLIYQSVLRKNARARPAFSVMREPNALLAKFWSERRVELVAARTFPELEALGAQLSKAVRRARAREWSLESVLETHFPDEHDDVMKLVEDVGARFTDRLATLEPFLWANLSPSELESYSDDAADDVLGAFRVLRALVRGGFPVRAGALAQAGELLARFGHHDEARAALELALRRFRSSGGAGTAHLRSSLGRVLCRLGEFERARVFLERALEEGDSEDVWGRAAELAWLSRCVLERVDRLLERARHRAAAELIGAFLRQQADRFSLAREDPAGEGEGARWSAYYVNLRLGRIMGLAAEMAAESGAVYATQAVELLVHAIDLAPFKPDPYWAIRALLTEPRHETRDPDRWRALVAAAPPGVQRKLLPVR